jgi:hypothetical protein
MVLSQSEMNDIASEIRISIPIALGLALFLSTVTNAGSIIPQKSYAQGEVTDSVTQANWEQTSGSYPHGPPESPKASGVLNRLYTHIQYT